MAERQYIGARYVPILFDNPSTHDASWMSGIAYEPLTIVTYANNTFTSKKYVPAGIGSPNTNTEYWINTANYNAQIQEIANNLRNEMTRLENETNTKLATKQPVFNERRFILIGDSYAKVTPQSWITSFTYSLAIPTNQYHDMSVSGDGFTSGGSASNGFLTQLQNAVSAGYDQEEITDIVVAGGLNDSTFSTAPAAYQSLVPAINDFCTYAKTHFPKAKVWIAYVGFASDTSSVLANRNVTARHIAQWAYSQAKPHTNTETAINIEAWKILGQNVSYMGSDLVHPSAAGSADLGNQLAHWVSGENTYVLRPEEGAGPFMITMDNQGVHVNIKAGPPEIDDAIPAESAGYTLTESLPFFVNKKFYAYGNIQSGGSGTFALNQIKYTFSNRTVKITPQTKYGSRSFDRLYAAIQSR